MALTANGLAQTYSKSGSVYEDYNGNAALDAGEPGTNAGGNLCAYLINSSSNVVLQSQAIAADGSYTFSGLAALSGANYVVGIGTCGIANGTTFSGGSGTYNSYLNLPSAWSIVAPTANKWADVGNATNSNGNNFFIRKLPISANDVQSAFLGCSSSGCISIPGLSGTAASVNASYSITGYRIITIPSGGTLNAGGSAVTAGQTITSANAANLCFTKTAGAVGIATFTYVAVNNIGGNDYMSPNAATYIIRLGGGDFRRDDPSSILLTCNSQSTSLNAPFTSDTTGLTFTYSWTGPNGFSSNLKNPILAPNTPVEDGLYIVTATDQNGCQSTDTLKTKRMNCFSQCDGDNGYFVKGPGTSNSESIYQYNIPTGTTTTVTNTLQPMDAVCFNLSNNLIYGWATGASPSRHIFAVDAAGKQVDLGASIDASLFNTFNYAGTCGPDGKWYLARPTGDVNLRMLDINPSSPTYMRAAGVVVVSGGTIDSYDFAWSDCDQMIYGVSGTEVYQINPVTGTITKFPTNLAAGFNYGAQFMDYNCNLFVAENTTGNVYKAAIGSSPGGTITFNLYSSGPTGIFNDATISPFKPSDFGDAPASYGLVYHKFNCAGGLGSELLYLGTNIDYESTQLYSNDALGDDNMITGITINSADDGLTSYSALVPCGVIDTFSVTIKTYNNTGGNAVLSGWVDFNNNGVFDLSERQQVTIANNQTSATLKWTGITASPSPASFVYARFRVGTGAQVDNPTGGALLGEVEDYRLPVMGVDFGDAPSATYGQPVSYVYPDLNGDNTPDNASALWLGNSAQGKDGSAGCVGVYNSYATGDDNDGVNDEDGVAVPPIFHSGPATISFVANGTTHGQTAYYGIWIDWNRDGFTNTPDEFYSGNYIVGSPVTITQAINVPWTLTSTSLIYLRFRVAATPLVYTDYNSVLVNSETEDYFVNNAVLPVSLTSFTLEKKCIDGVLLRWQTSSEQNNRGFNIQHSLNASTWETIGFVDGAGNSTKPVDYRFEQDELTAGMHYYRLQQLDFDGNIKTSVTRRVNISEEATVRIYPNPAKDKIYVFDADIQQSAAINIYNSTGSLVLFKKELHSGEPLNIQQLPSGVYVLKMTYLDEPPIYRKFIKE